MEFAGVLKKQQVDFSGVNQDMGLIPGKCRIKKKLWGISRGLGLGLKISEGCNTIMWSFCRGEPYFVWNFQGVK